MRWLSPRRAWGAALLVVLLTVALLSTTGSPPAAAHPLGNFTVNAYDGLTVSPRELRVDHVEDLAEIPATQAEARIDANGDRRLDAAERTAWARRTCDRAAREGALTVNDRPVRLTSRSERARALRRPGQAGLSTLRVECRLTARLALARDAGTVVRFSGGMSVGADGPGWRETTARGDRARLLRTDVPARSASARLTRYPDDLLSTPLRQRGAHLSVRPGGPALAEDGNGAGERARPGAVTALPRGVDGLTQRFTDLVGSHRLTLGFGLLALALAAVLGAAHALAPGHGKTVMAAYAAGGGPGSFRSLLRIGATVTVTHTAGVLVLGAVVAAGSQAAPLAIPWLTALSGLLVAVAGVALLRRALVHRAGHGHGHGHTHGHGSGAGHSHHHEGDAGHPVGDAGHHVGDAGHSHSDSHSHSHTSVLVRNAAPAVREGDSEDNGADEAPPKRRRRPALAPARPRMRDTLLLGFAGGMVPSPSAVLVLVGSSALGQLWFGVLLVLAYGAGLAFTLVVVAVLLVRVGARLGQRLMGAAPRYERVFGFLHRTGPAVTAGLVVLLGGVLALRGIVGAG
ncbi:nickel transporter [Streptomyces sp. NPDC003077]|uniref:nickel transporter n=1 Tax=Streptomyces sp. NPDC003077 TaxID=3154443 RepID=UPI0033B7374F